MIILHAKLLRMALCKVSKGFFGVLCISIGSNLDTPTAAAALPFDFKHSTSEIWLIMPFSAESTTEGKLKSTAMGSTATATAIWRR